MNDLESSFGPAYEFFNQDLAWHPEIDRIQRFVDSLYKRILTKHPHSEVELGSYCHEVDQFLSTIDLDDEVKKSVQNLRIDIAKSIRRLMRKKSAWEMLDWSTPDATVEGYRKVISSYLNIPIPFPEKSTDEWCAARMALMRLVSKDIVRMGLSESQTSKTNRHFSSYKTIIFCAFGEYFELEGTSDPNAYAFKFQWRTQEETLNNVYRIVSDQLKLPRNRLPEHNSPEWRRLRRKLGAITAIQMYEWGLHGAFHTKNQWYNSHLSVLEEAFPHYDLERIFEKRKHRTKFTWQSKEEALQNIKSTIDEEENVPESTPPKGSAEWNEIRGQLIGIQSDHFELWGLKRAFRGGRYYRSYMEAMVDIYGKDYDISEADLNKRTYVYEWSSRRMTIQNVYKAVSEYCSLPQMAPKKGTKEWEACRARILSVDYHTFLSLGLSAAIHQNKWFSAYGETLIAAFNRDYQIANDVQVRRHIVKFAWGTREEIIVSVRAGLEERLKLSEIAPERAREKLDIIRKKDMREWGMRNAYKNKTVFSDLEEIKRAAFPEYY